MKSFIIKSTVLTIIVFILGATVYFTALTQFYLPVLIAIPVFFYIITNLVHYYLTRIVDKSGAKFTSQYMATSFIKMFFYLAIAIVYVLLNRKNAKVFTANYLLLYLIYTVFEVYEFSKILKQKN